MINENASLDFSFNVRKNRNIAGKQLIARLASRMVHDGDSLMLDASSTAVYIARALKEKKNLIVITNSIEIIIELLDMTDWKVLSTGGASRVSSYALVGPQTDKMLRDYHVDRAFVSCKGFDLDAGFTDSDELHANNKKTMLDAAKEKILVVDSSKFGETAFVSIGALADINVVVTDKKPDDKWLQAFQAAGVDCVYPE